MIIRRCRGPFMLDNRDSTVHVKCSFQQVRLPMVVVLLSKVLFMVQKLIYRVGMAQHILLLRSSSIFQVALNIFKLVREH